MFEFDSKLVLKITTSNFGETFTQNSALFIKKGESWLFYYNDTIEHFGKSTQNLYHNFLNRICIQKIMFN